METDLYKVHSSKCYNNKIIIAKTKDLKFDRTQQKSVKKLSFNKKIKKIKIKANTIYIHTQKEKTQASRDIFALQPLNMLKHNLVTHLWYVRGKNTLMHGYL